MFKSAFFNRSSTFNSWCNREKDITDCTFDFLGIKLIKVAAIIIFIHVNHQNHFTRENIWNLSLAWFFLLLSLSLRIISGNKAIKTAWSENSTGSYVIGINDYQCLQQMALLNYYNFLFLKLISSPIFLKNN